MNREKQLRQTLENNLAMLAAFDGNVELCLVNFIKDNEGEAIHEWIMGLQRPAHFGYYVSRALPVWHASVAKNTSHIASRGRYLVNLDCDNFITREEVEGLLVYDQGVLEKKLYSGFSGSFKRDERKLLHRLIPKLKSRYTYRPTKDSNAHWSDGTYGRLGSSRTSFLAIGGYDESLPPMGGQDLDLFMRLQGRYPLYDLIHIPSVLLPIPNSKAEGLAHTNMSGSEWEAINAGTMDLVKKKWENRDFVANQSKTIGVDFTAVTG